MEPKTTILVGQRSADGRIPGRQANCFHGEQAQAQISARVGPWRSPRVAAGCLRKRRQQYDFHISRRGRTGLKLVTTAPSGGTFPDSVAVSRDLVYVLDEGAKGVPANISGFAFDDDRGALPDGKFNPASERRLQSRQISWGKDESLIFVTERATNLIDSYEIQADGTPDGPHFNTSNGQTPFGFSFDPWNHMIVSEAETGNPLHPLPNKGAASSYSVNDEGVLDD